MARLRKTTGDQRFYEVDGQWRADIDVCVTDEDIDAPSFKDCRHAVLQIAIPPTKPSTPHTTYNTYGFVVYDRLLNRIVNGVFDNLEGALEVARSYNRDPSTNQEMAPNGYALALTYPDPEEEDE